MSALRRRLVNVPSILLALAQIIGLLVLGSVLPPWIRWTWIAVSSLCMAWLVFYWWLVNFKGHTPGHWEAK